MKDQRRYYAEDRCVYDRWQPSFSGIGNVRVATVVCISSTLAKRIAAALNIYKPRKRHRVRGQKSAEKGE
jgi:hypothetical protein